MVHTHPYLHAGTVVNIEQHGQSRTRVAVLSISPDRSPDVNLLSFLDPRQLISLFHLIQKVIALSKYSTTKKI